MHSKWKYINLGAFFFLSSFLIIFYSAIYLEMSDFYSKILFFIGLFLLVIGLTVEKTKLKHERYTLAREIEVLIALPVAAMLTFFLSINLEFGPVVSASLVAFVYTLIFSKFGKSWSNLSNPIYCGTFVGMSSSLIFTEMWTIGIAGLLSAIIFIASHEIYNETGGTSGTIAFTGVNLTKRILLKIIEMIL